jgi:hypothetical protein
MHMPATKDGFLLTPLDLEYLRAVYLLRVGTINHLAALTNRSYTRTQKRAAKLETRGYLAALTRPPRKILYALGPEGVAALVEIGYVPDALLEKRIRTKELKDLFLQHLMLVKDVQVKLITQARGTSIEIARWDEGEQINDSVMIEEKRKEKSALVKIPVRPDAFFVLRDAARPEGKNLAPFVLEADRSTEGHETLRTKLKGYIHFILQDRVYGKWGFKRFHVLIVTENAKRADNLQNELLKLVPPEFRSRFLIVTTLDVLTLDALVPPVSTSSAGPDPA